MMLLRNFVLGTTIPKRRFTSEDESQDFRSLGLTPASVLTVIPKSNSSGGGGGLLGSIMAIPFFFVNLIIKILGSIFPGAQTPPVEAPANQNQVFSMKIFISKLTQEFIPNLYLKKYYRGKYTIYEGYEGFFVRKASSQCLIFAGFSGL